MRKETTDPQGRTVIQFDQECACKFKWGPVIAELKKGEASKTIDLKCPDCGIKREITITRQGPGKYPIAGGKQED